MQKSFKRKNSKNAINQNSHTISRTHMQGNEKITEHFSSLKRSGVYAALTRNKKVFFKCDKHVQGVKET